MTSATAICGTVLGKIPNKDNRHRECYAVYAGLRRAYFHLIELLFISLLVHRFQCSWLLHVQLNLLLLLRLHHYHVRLLEVGL